MGTSGDMLGTGVSALLATQRSLSTTSHNISNVNTDGYNRQTVALTARAPMPAGNGFIGTGVQTLSVRRVYDQFINDQVLVNNAGSSRLDSYSRYTAQVDNLLADVSTGLSSSMTAFFNATHDVATDPSSIPARQVLLSQGQALADRFHNLNASLDAMSKGVTQDLGNEAAAITSLAQSIAKLNNDIAVASGAAGGQLPNDMLDQRDRLIEELSGHISVQVVSQDDGSKNVFIGNGQSLVVGTTAAALSVTPNQYDASQAEITMTLGGSSVVISNGLSGGSIGGIFEFRDQVLNPARNQVGLLAISIAQTFNDQHNLGFTLDGNAGQDFFSIGAPQVLSSTSNTGSAALTAQFSNVPGLTADDYTVNFTGGNYLLTNNTTNVTQTLGPTGPFTVAGMTINVSGSAAAGDRFIIRPTRGGADSIQMALTDPRAVAAAASTNSPGDNRNALALAGLQTTGILGNGVTTYEQAYGQLVSKVGTQAHSAQLNLAAQNALLAQSKDQRASMSGVNLDEEAANLLRFQQAYQAAAQVIAISTSLFDTLLGAVRR